MPLPVHRGAADRHGAADDPLAPLVLDEVARPLVLVVGKRPAAVFEAVLRIEEPPARLNHDHAELRRLLRELLRQQRRRDATPDHADVGLDTARGAHFFTSGGGTRADDSKVRQRSFPMAAW